MNAKVSELLPSKPPSTSSEHRNLKSWQLTALNPERRFLLQHVGFDKTIARAAGCYLFDEQGIPYVDGLAQYGAVPFGHNPPQVWERIERVRRNNEPCFVQPLFNRASEALAHRLVALLPHMARVVFVNSGAEATEAAIKLVRARTGKRRIVTVERGFHGKTNAALCATANRRYREPFLPDEAQFVTARFGDLRALEAIFSAGDVAAFIVEPVQGEGGMRVQPPGYLQAAQALCRRHGVMLVIDEVQSGLGRTGKMFGFEQHGELQPDVVLLAKALGGGLLPLGAVLCTDDAWTESFGMLHSSTFANNHLAATVGGAVLDLLQLDDGALLHHVVRKSERLRAGLQGILHRYPDAIAAVHGQGLMLGVELMPWSGETSYFNSHASYCGYAVPIVSGYLLNTHQVLMAPTFNSASVLRVQPALTVGDSEIDSMLQALDNAAYLIEHEEFDQLFSCMTPTSGLHVAGRARRIAKSQPLSLTPDEVKSKPRFAFLIHATDDNARFEILPPAIKDQGEPTRSAWLKWLDSWTQKMHEPAPVLRVTSLRSKTGVDVEGWLIATQLIPEELIRMGAEARDQLMDRYLEEARKLDVDMVGLGAFTSVITQGGQTVLDSGLHITTGNSLTALSSAEMLLRYAALCSNTLDNECFAVVGAAGSCGRLAAYHLAMNGATRLRLVGNAANRKAMLALRAVAGEILSHALRYGTADDAHGLAAVLRFLPRHVRAVLASQELDDDQARAGFYDECAAAFTLYAHCECPIMVTTDVVAGVRDARFILTATSAGRSFITPDVFMSGSVVCDVARPLDVLNRVQGVRDDVTVFEGGLLRLPTPLRFGDQNVLGCPDGVALACLSETIVLAMEGIQRHCSIGNRIPYSEATFIYATALKHGFSLYFDPQLHARMQREDEAEWLDAVTDGAVATLQVEPQ